MPTQMKVLKELQVWSATQEGLPRVMYCEMFLHRTLGPGLDSHVRLAPRAWLSYAKKLAATIFSVGVDRAFAMDVVRLGMRMSPVSAFAIMTRAMGSSWLDGCVPRGRYFDEEWFRSPSMHTANVMMCR